MRAFRRPVRAERLINLNETVCDKIEPLLLQCKEAHAGVTNFIAFGDWHFPCVFRNKPMAGEDPAPAIANLKRVFERAWELLEAGKESV